MNFTNSCTMQKSALILTVFLTLSCLTFNYTFPLHRDSEEPKFYTTNETQSYNVGDVVDRTKKMAVNVFKRLKNNNPEESKEIPKDNSAKEQLNITARQLNDKVPVGDFRSFEQLVIMKKYPYLDLKEFEAKYTLSPEHARHNQKLYSGSNFGNDPGICERQVAEVDTLMVEVNNRGQSGFAIPKLGDQRNVQESVQINLALPKKTNKTVLEGLKSDVTAYLQDKGIVGKINEINH